MSAHVVRFEPVSMPTGAGSHVDTGLLTVIERSRRDRLRRPEDRAAYVAAHVLVRHCAAELLQVPAESVRIVQTCPQCGPEPGHGVPSVVDHPEIWVSLSHSSRHVAAIAAYAPAGIDVETLDDDHVITAALSDREREWVAAQAEPDRAFRRLWVRKEAFIKAGGAALDDAARIDVLTQTAGRLLQPDPVAYTEWSARDAIGAWTVLGS